MRMRRATLTAAAVVTLAAGLGGYVQRGWQANPDVVRKTSERQSNFN
jgi:hypothetical protein